jgi:hypothetical protein
LNGLVTTQCRATKGKDRSLALHCRISQFLGGDHRTALHRHHGQAFGSKALHNGTDLVDKGALDAKFLEVHIHINMPCG